MSNTNLQDDQAISKLKELVENIDFAMMETNLGSRPTHIIPMSTKEVDDQGCIWFLSNANSDHNSHIEKDDELQLIYSKPSDMEFIAVFGKAMITKDRSILKRLYVKMDDMWFSGVDDPKLSAIKVTPINAHFWDTKSNKLITLFNMGMSLLTGEQKEIGEEGELDL